MENHRNKKIKFLRSNRGGEYLSYEFGLQLKQCEIVLLLTPPGTPQHNGVSECHNRTLLDSAIYDVSYRFTTIILGLCIRDNCIHVKIGHHLNPLRRHRMNYGLARNLSCRLLKFEVAMLIRKRFILIG